MSESNGWEMEFTRSWRQDECIPTMERISQQYYQTLLGVLDLRCGKGTDCIRELAWDPLCNMRMLTAHGHAKRCRSLNGEDGTGTQHMAVLRILYHKVEGGFSACLARALGYHAQNGITLIMKCLSRAHFRSFLIIIQSTHTA